MTMTSLQRGLYESPTVEGLARAALCVLSAVLFFAGNVIVPAGDFGTAMAQDSDEDDDGRMSGRKTQALSKNVTT